MSRTPTVYLNHAGTSWPKPLPVQAAIADGMKCSPTTWGEQFHSATQLLRRFLDIRDEHELLLTPGCTSALAVAISDLQWEAGDCVVTSSWEHHALQRPVIQLAERGVQQRIIPPSHDCLFDLEKLEECLQHERVRLVAVTSACNVTGARLPIQNIIDLAHRYQALALIDAAQIVGWDDLSLHNLDADIVCFGSHKALQGPWGIGGLYVNARVPMVCFSAQCDLSSLNESNTKAARPGYCDVGSVDQLTLRGLGAACTWLSDAEQRDRLEKALHQRRFLSDQLSTIEAVKFVGQQYTTESLPTVAFNVQDMPASIVVQKLGEAGVVGSGGLQCSPMAHETLGTESSGVVRLSVGIQQPTSEIELAAERILETLRRR